MFAILTFEFRILTLKGEKKYVAMELSVTTEYEDTLSVVLVSLLDITNLKHAEQKNQATLDAIPDLMFQLDKKGMHVAFKGKKEELFIAY